MLNLYRVLLNSPKLAEAWLQLFTVIRQQCELPAQYRELVIMIIAVINGADYEYRRHVPFALAAGLTQAQLDELPRWRESALFDASQRAVLDYAESMTRDVHVPDAVFERCAALRSAPDRRAHGDDRRLQPRIALPGGARSRSRVRIRQDFLATLLNFLLYI